MSVTVGDARTGRTVVIQVMLAVKEMCLQATVMRENCVDVNEFPRVTLVVFVVS